MGRARPSPLPPPPPTRHDHHTPGTTGTPKSVPRSNILEIEGTLGVIPPDDEAFSAAALQHVLASVNVLILYLGGGALPTRSPTEILAALEEGYDPGHGAPVLLSLPQPIQEELATNRRPCAGLFCAARLNRFSRSASVSTWAPASSPGFTAVSVQDRLFISGGSTSIPRWPGFHDGFTILRGTA